MTDPFAEFGATYAPRRGKPKRKPKPVKTEQERREERGQLDKHARAAEATYRKRLFEGSMLGRRLEAFLKKIPEDPTGMVRAVATALWLRNADLSYRWLALKVLDEKISRIRKKAGLPELDDPLPGEPNNVFLELKHLLRVR